MESLNNQSVVLYKQTEKNQKERFQYYLNNIFQKSNFSKDVFSSESILTENNMNQNNKNEIFTNVESIFIKNVIKINKEEIQKKIEVYVICEYDINKDEIYKTIQILNSYEEVKRKNPDWDWENIKAIENEKEKRKL